jgi:hypothetical protein
MNIEKSVTVRCSEYSNLAVTLKDVLEQVPGGASFDLHKSEGDRPWESASYTITFNWTEEV